MLVRELNHEPSYAINESTINEKSTLITDKEYFTRAFSLCIFMHYDCIDVFLVSAYDCDFHDNCRYQYVRDVC